MPIFQAFARTLAVHRKAMDKQLQKSKTAGKVEKKEKVEVEKVAPAMEQ